MIRERLAYAGERMRVVDDVAELPVDAFDYLFAFEVLVSTPRILDPGITRGLRAN